jgi:DNA-binding FadR family transcriptional regulator
MRKSAHREIVRAISARKVTDARDAIHDHYVYARERLFSGQLREPSASKPLEP